mmetsp:Transcript_89177/g.277235  ORF Transcript_89177/g.277235 Transcript_89177/m.277235 type:complete len:224 (-) Transcript_89177:2110-2781(-)
MHKHGRRRHRYEDPRHGTASQAACGGKPLLHRWPYLDAASLMPAKFDCTSHTISRRKPMNVKTESSSMSSLSFSVNLSSKLLVRCTPSERIRARTPCDLRPYSGVSSTWKPSSPSLSFSLAIVLRKMLRNCSHSLSLRSSSLATLATWCSSSCSISRLSMRASWTKIQNPILTVLPSPTSSMPASFARFRAISSLRIKMTCPSLLLGCQLKDFRSSTSSRLSM